MSPMSSNRRQVAVIGAGIVGAMIAAQLQKVGDDVIIIEPEMPGGRHAASFGNGGWISASLVNPLATPELLRKLPKLLLSKDSPFSIDAITALRIAPWLIRFAIAAFQAPRISASLASLLNDCESHHLSVVRDIGAEALFDRDGQIQVWRKRSDYDGDEATWRRWREAGVEWTEIETEQLRQRLPHLSPEYTFGIHVPGTYCRSPSDYVAALVRHVTARGGRLLKANATGFELRGNRLVGVRTQTGTVSCDAAVIAAGVRSAQLTRGLGQKIPLIGERGYHAVIRGGLDPAPQERVLFMDIPAATTPSPVGLRVTGCVELKALDAPADWTKAKHLRDTVVRAYGGEPSRLGEDDYSYWLGARPSTPDSLPVIGQASASSDIMFAFGHGHVGLCTSAKTGRIVADLLHGAVPEIDVSPFSPARFAAKPLRKAPTRSRPAESAQTAQPEATGSSVGSPASSAPMPSRSLRS